MSQDNQDRQEENVRDFLKEFFPEDLIEKVIDSNHGLTYDQRRMLISQQMDNGSVFQVIKYLIEGYTVLEQIFASKGELVAAKAYFNVNADLKLLLDKVIAEELVEKALKSTDLDSL